MRTTVTSERVGNTGARFEVVQNTTVCVCRYPKQGKNRSGVYQTGDPLAEVIIMLS